MTPPDLPNFPPVPPTLPPVTDTNPSHYTGVPLNLGNQVWYDANNNGKLDSGEVGVAGVAVELYADTNGDGVLTRTEIEAAEEPEEPEEPVGCTYPGSSKAFGETALGRLIRAIQGHVTSYLAG